MYDPYKRVMRPDFNAPLPEASLPQWQPMGEDNQSEQIGQSAGSIGALLKERFGGSSKAGGMPGMEGKAGGMGSL